MTRTFRRVVTGHNAAGRAIFASDERVPSLPLAGLPGTEICDLWGADTTLNYPDRGGKPAYEAFFPTTTVVAPSWSTRTLFTKSSGVIAANSGVNFITAT